MIKDICYIFNDDYAVLSGISLYSLIKTNSEYDLTIHILCNRVTEINKEKLKSLTAGTKCSIVFYDIAAENYDFVERGVSSYDRIVYARLFLDKYLPSNVHKIMYIDGDTIVYDSIADLLDYQMKDYVVAGVKDRSGVQLGNIIELMNPEYYINSGVLLINLDKWREFNLSQKVIETVKTKGRDFGFIDQDLLNKICETVIDCNIEYKFNTITDYFDSDIAKKAVILHYGGFNYRTRNRLLMERLVKELNGTPWTVRDLTDNRTIERKIKDALLVVVLHSPIKYLYSFIMKVYSRVKEKQI